MTIYDEIEARRAQQIAKGYDAAHDDEHDKGEIAKAAAAYAMAGAKASPAGAMLWPWSIDQFRPSETRANLIDAAALCVAEIERLDRADQQNEPPAPPKPRLAECNASACHQEIPDQMKTWR